MVSELISLLTVLLIVNVRCVSDLGEFHAQICVQPWSVGTQNVYSETCNGPGTNKRKLLHVISSVVFFLFII